MIPTFTSCKDLFAHPSFTGDERRELRFILLEAGVPPAPRYTKADDGHFVRDPLTPEQERMGYGNPNPRMEWQPKPVDNLTDEQRAFILREWNRYAEDMNEIDE